MHRGYTKHWRKIWDNGYHKDPLLMVMIQYFIDFSAFKKTRVFQKGIGIIELDRGEWLISERKLSEFFGVDRQQIRTRIDQLETLEFLTRQSTHRITKIKVINYDLYQSGEDQANPVINPNLTQSKPTALNTKNAKKVKNRDSVVTGAGAHAFKETTEIPSWIPIQIWKDFKEFRVKKRAPLTDRAIKKTIEELARLRAAGDDPEDVLEQSIYRGWTGVFALKSDFKRMSPQTRAEKSKASMEVFRRRECERQREEAGLGEEEGNRSAACADDGLLSDRGL